ncbi:general substrate transporter [Halenospora varia]|nr:general substrate transporter [Halenospora varia]
MAEPHGDSKIVEANAHHLEGLDNVANEKIQDNSVEAAKHDLNRVDLDQLSKDAITIKSRAARRLAVVIMIQGLSVAAFAIDGSSIGGITALPAFRSYFHVGTSGAALGIINAAMSIGNICASPFQWLSDLIGRRGVSFIGNVILILSGILMAAAPNTAALIVGRVFSGVGASLSATVGPLYMSEIAPSSRRGLAIGLYCASYSIGAIVIAVVLLGGSYMEDNWSWRLPMLFQIGAPFIVACLIYPCTPESPRYLYATGKYDQARKVIARYHTTSEDIHDPVVIAEIEQIRESMERHDAKPWDFSLLYKTVNSRRRLWIIFLYSFFQQCNGSGMLWYYLPGVLKLVGVTNTQQVLGINLGLTVVGYLSTIGGSFIVDKVRRRTLLFTGWSVYIFFLALMSLCGGLYASNIGKKPTGYIVTIALFMFNICTGLFVNALHNMYPNEVLHYSQRAKGMGMYSFFQNCFGFAMSYGFSIVLADLQWKTYFVFMGINSLAVYATWQWFPEFRHLSLEEIDIVFETNGTRPVALANKLQEAKKEKRGELHLA